MIKATFVEPAGDNESKVFVKLFADTKDEVETTPLDDIKGFPKGKYIEMGSSCITASLDIGFMKSDGTWQWS